MKLYALTTFNLSPQRTLRRGDEFECSDRLGQRYLDMRMATKENPKAPLAKGRRTGAAKRSSSSAPGRARKAKALKSPEAAPES